MLTDKTAAELERLAERTLEKAREAGAAGDYAECAKHTSKLFAIQRARRAKGAIR